MVSVAGVVNYKITADIGNAQINEQVKQFGIVVKDNGLWVVRKHQGLGIIRNAPTVNVKIINVGTMLSYGN